MKHKVHPRTVAILLASSVLLLASCATRPAPDFGGRWKAVNRYAEAPDEIPLYKAYSFHASPMDGTLKTMLTRWANDSKMTLSYQHPSDFTLYAPVARIQTYDLQQAVSQVSDAYATQNLEVTIESNQIVVRAPAVGGSASVSDDTAKGTP